MHFCSIEYGWSKQGENPAIPDLSGERHGGHQLAEKNIEWTFQPLILGSTRFHVTLETSNKIA